MADIVNYVEKARNATIKEKISGTHNWVKAVSVEKDGRVNIFLCPKCNLKASAFECIRTISIISKVHDHKPTYTVHNEYLQYTCEEAQVLQYNSDNECIDCGISGAVATPACILEKIK